jgi:hypothetical protein
VAGWGDYDADGRGDALGQCRDRGELPVASTGSRWQPKATFPRSPDPTGRWSNEDHDGLHQPAADFNGDGKADLVLRHTDGTVQVWLMNGAAVMQIATWANAGSGWSALLAGDLNGDSKADMLWQSHGRVRRGVADERAIVDQLGVAGGRRPLACGAAAEMRT